jgi:O-antigen/teichoic acid export membrane protein
VSRTHRFLSGVSLGYAYLGLVTVVGLWLTPFLLGRIGTEDFGLWLVTTQILGYLQLLDLGVVALAPREMAYATGRTLQGASADEPALVMARFRRVVLWQLPLAVSAAAAIWWIGGYRWPELRWPLGAVLGAFAIAFPFRLNQAALQGLQDLGYLGKVQLAAWVAGTATTIVLVLLGAELGALVAGWIVTQFTSAIACVARMRVQFGRIWAEPSTTLPWADAKGLVTRAGWVSAAQVGQVFLNGSDLLIIGAVLGPAAAVPYSCTGKLVSVLANHPQLLMQTAAPALAEMRTSESRARVAEVATALMRAMLVISGAVACLVLAVNELFVSWWVGADLYAGPWLTTLLVVAMLCRHLATSLTYALFSFGHERRISLVALGDGVITLGTTAVLALTTPLGLLSAALGSLSGVLLVSLPFIASALGRELGIGVAALLASQAQWLWRFLAASGILILLGRLIEPHGLPGLLVMAAIVAVVYGALMLPLALKPPLGGFVRSAVGPALALFGRQQAAGTRP